MFTYKGYTGDVSIDAEAGVITGRVLDIKDVVTFEGKTVSEAHQAFKESVDEYLDFCSELGRKPNKPFSGRLPYRTSPDVHRKIYIAAARSGQSINSWMDDTLRKEADRELADLLV